MRRLRGRGPPGLIGALGDGSLGGRQPGDRYPVGGMQADAAATFGEIVFGV